MKQNNAAAAEQTNEEIPPVFKRWSAWYALVLGALGAMMFFLYLFSRAFQ